MMEGKNTLKNEGASLVLSKENFLGKGEHKAAYVHPQNDKLCIKIPISLPDKDIDKELAYRKALDDRKKNLALMPEYYGTVMTNLGEGFVFERVVDYDGTPGVELKTAMKEMNIQDTYGVSPMEFMKRFRTMMLTDKIVVSDVDPLNFMVMRTSLTEFTFKVVDNVGTPVLLPLAYYFDFVAEKRIKKYWNRFIDGCKKEYTNMLTIKEWEELYA